MPVSIDTRPVVGLVYGFGSGDTIAAIGAETDAGAPFALVNLTDPVTMFRGRTTGSTTLTGFEFDLAAQINVFAVELVNTGAFAAELLRFELYSDATFTVLALDTGAGWTQRPEEIWTGHTGIHVDKPIRPNVLAGFDDLTGGVGPAIASPPVPTTVATQSGRLILSIPNGSRTTGWEGGYIALGTDPLALPDIEKAKLSTAQLAMRHGDGWIYTIDYGTVKIGRAEMADISAFWARSSRGTHPVMFFPVPGSRQAADGKITDPDFLHQERGGACRMLEPKPGNRTLQGNSWFWVNTRLQFQTWEEL
jgi:hypothetical protein